MALAKKIVEDFNRVYAPVAANSNHANQHGSNGMSNQSDGVKDDENDEEDGEDEDADGEEKKTSNSMLHMDTCKLKHEESANQANSIQVSGLLQSDSLERRGVMAAATSEDQVEVSPRGTAAEGESGFEILDREEGISLHVEPKLVKAQSAPKSSGAKKKLSQLEKFSQNVEKLGGDTK